MSGGQSGTLRQVPGGGRQLDGVVKGSRLTRCWSRASRAAVDDRVDWRAVVVGRCLDLVFGMFEDWESRQATG